MEMKLYTMRETVDRKSIPEPAPSLSRHEAPIGGIWVLPTIKITVILHMYCGLSVKVNTRENAVRCVKIMDTFFFFCVCFHLWLVIIPQLELHS